MGPPSVGRVLWGAPEHLAALGSASPAGRPAKSICTAQAARARGMSSCVPATGGWSATAERDASFGGTRPAARVYSTLCHRLLETEAASVAGVLVAYHMASLCYPTLAPLRHPHLRPFRMVVVGRPPCPPICREHAGAKTKGSRERTSTKKSTDTRKKVQVLFKRAIQSAETRARSSAVVTFGARLVRL